MKRQLIELLLLVIIVTIGTVLDLLFHAPLWLAMVVGFGLGSAIPIIADWMGL